ncbi:MAG: hypothetical protein EXR68_07440 [Dehalococcoidia bacterium]|nr:hypothetical protein [Dehalococcoidia bacterium]
MFGAFGTAILTSGIAVAQPLFSAVLGAVLGMLVIVGLYVLRLMENESAPVRREQADSPQHPRVHRYSDSWSWRSSEQFGGVG